MAKLEINDAGKFFGRNEVVKHASVSAQNGEFLVILGPSGCGKSTLLRMIAGLEAVSYGEIILDGVKINDVEPKDRDIAMVFQNYALYPHMTVFDNMAYGLKVRKNSKSDIVSKVESAAKFLDIIELLDRKPSQLSGGQRQRVAMGRAVVRNPKIFLFDEPLSNLDAKLRHQMRIEIKQLHKKLNATSIFVTHDQIEAMTLADKIIVMNNGQIQQTGTALDVYKKPANTFVASFIGYPTINFFDFNGYLGGKIKEKSLNLFGNNENYMQNNNNILLGLRPESIKLQANSTKELLNIQGKVILIEPLGANVILNCLCCHSGEEFCTLLSETDSNNINIEDEILFYFEVQECHIFDKNTGVRLN